MHCIDSRPFAAGSLVLRIEAEFMDAARNTAQRVARYAQPEFAYAIVNRLSWAPRSQESRPSSVVSDSEWTRALRKYLSGQPSLKPRHDSCRAVAVPPDAFRLRRDVVQGLRFQPRCFKPWLARGSLLFPSRKSHKGKNTLYRVLGMS